MNGEQAKCFLFAQAAVARVAGMQVANAERERHGYAPAYDEGAFFAEATRIEELAIQLVNAS